MIEVTVNGIELLLKRIAELEAENLNLIARLEEQTSYATMLTHKEDSIKDGYELKIVRFESELSKPLNYNTNLLQENITIDSS